ncbi:MAG TPA: UDP-N-acetylmuramoyl-L-alanine--D-glutamate ligase [Streptosporangiaceae bacterium]|nr:UDP-N-acetylmuramoyl-L-alanine--D-glutamate ligase [Streptosporangiaceae bacterium]
MAADLAGRFAESLRGLRVCVAGLGVSGPPAARVLASLGAVVTAVDSRDDTERQKIASELIDLGIDVRLGGAAAAVPNGTGLVVTSPGWQPDAPLLVAAATAGIDVIGDVELAWRLRPQLPGGGWQRWLAVTGTNGKTTTVRMLALMLEAAGYRSIAAGNVGTSLVEVVTDPEPYEVVAVELSSFQLYWSSTIAAQAAALLNVAAHHLDWHGTFEAYADAKAKIFVPGATAIGNLDDEWSARLTRAAGRAGRVVMFSLSEPGAGELGVGGGMLLDRAFGPEGESMELAAVSDLAWTGPEDDQALVAEGPQALAANLSSSKGIKKRAPAPHNISDALAAAALARSYGAPPEAVRAGLAAFRPDPHRITLVAAVRGVDYVDDSKATNPHAAAASLAAYRRVVWVAGGLLKGADDDLDGLVAASAPRLRGVVLLGADRAKIAAALSRHAPDIPVVEVTGPDTGIMELVVRAAAKLAEPGDTVLLAPAAQSFDMFRDYPARGDAFADAVRRLAAAR